MDTMKRMGTVKRRKEMANECYCTCSNYNCINKEEFLASPYSFCSSCGSILEPVRNKEIEKEEDIEDDE